MLARVKLLVAPLLVAVFGLATAAAAGAAVTIGDSLANAGTPFGCVLANPCAELITAVSGGGQAAAPSDGVIVR